ncbi:hypothetical protein GXB85_05370 [Cellulomonas sp. APG4]|uniref:hypothetical protein n=1 Tax=Cellulomonas sp. APG4 TaxID=1538656 RepID=UPI00137A256F|nr:hypothetical protein [Cellulomonas sp. APG4]NCT90381.1 hypothetical protein [Cellulomonas sp. APG4]
MSSTMDMPWVNDLEPSPSLAGAQTLTDITRNVAKTLGVPMSSDLADLVKQHATCEVNYNGESNTLVGTHHAVWLPDGSGSLTEPVFNADTALEVAQIAVTAWWSERLPAKERMRLQREWEDDLLRETREIVKDDGKSADD